VRRVPAIAGRELRSLFASPVAYAFLTLFAILTGFFFLTQLLVFQQQLIQLQQLQMFEQLREWNLNDQVLQYFFGVMAVILLFIVPGITMGLLAAEKANGTDELLLTSPITIWELVLGKFVAGALFVALLVALVGLYAGLLFLYGDPEPGKTGAGLLALLLVGWAYVAIGLFASSLTSSQAIAFFVTFVLLLLLWMLSFLADLGAAEGGSLGGGMLGALGDWTTNALRYLSSADHFEQLVKGLVSTRDVAYFGVIIACFLITTKAVVESVRWR
jgi:ABC-2 type transport system permease protein